ncbi:MAG TPA: hypothetical protein VFQ95_01420 [Rhodanobacteraceae bacterium]|nr:hypothetical protein [Rhodanobacteraceae bacterium]
MNAPPFCHTHLFALTIVSRLCQSVALACLFALGGCAHTVKIPLLPTIDNTPPPSRKAAMKALEDKAPCCRAFADLPFHDALPERPREFTIDKFSPVADLDGERTHFLTFVLPKFDKPYRIVFQAQPSARQLGNSFLLAPTATLLNADYQPLSTTDVGLCIYINWRPSMSGGFGAIKVDSADARYLVVSTSRKQLAAKTYWSQSPTSFSNVNVPSTSTFGGTQAATPVTSGSYDLEHSPEGSISLGKMTRAYADAVANGMCKKPNKAAGLLPELRSAIHDR